MRFFRKKETVVENMAFMAMFAGIDALLSLVAALLPVSAIFLMVVVPLTATIVALLCRARYFPIFFFATLGTCIAVSAWNFQNTLFYILPGLVVGGVYGFLLKKKAYPSVLVFLSGIVEFGFFYLSMALIQWIYGVDMRFFLLGLIGKGDSPNAPTIFPLFAFGYSLVQIGLTHIFIVAELSRFDLEISDEKKAPLLSPLATFISIGGVFAAIFVLPELGYLFLGFALYWAICSVVSLFPRPHWASYVCLGAFGFLSLLLFASLYKAMPFGTGLSLLSLFAAAMALSAIFNWLLSRKGRRN